ncbi:universal stress protein YxiE [Paenibacillus lautus]|uniref:universal stress protein n=1 Tax=Paenibacillus lautus TaxID=1401 RepID=UPI001B28B83A|nr:universal stress protein [Paenibacillus lautus]GIO99912.1 universal stress protein YxiE [Paenibacillus lautus]
MFDKIIVAIDKAEITNKLLDATVEIARNKQTQVTLVNVSQEFVSNGMTYVPENFLEEILNEMEKASLEQLQQAKSKLEESAGIHPETVHLKGDPAHEILKYARDTEQQLIIIGSRGLSGIKEMMLGSVSHKVSQLSNCPVLIVH